MLDQSLAAQNKLQQIVSCLGSLTGLTDYNTHLEDERILSQEFKEVFDLHGTAYAAAPATLPITFQMTYSTNPWLSPQHWQHCKLIPVNMKGFLVPIFLRAALGLYICLHMPFSWLTFTAFEHHSWGEGAMTLPFFKDSSLTIQTFT